MSKSNAQEEGVALFSRAPQTESHGFSESDKADTSICGIFIGQSGPLLMDVIENGE
jgi:hypothetical protein